MELTAKKLRAITQNTDRLNKPLSAFGGGRPEIETEEEMLDRVKTTASLRHAPFRESLPTSDSLALRPPASAPTKIDIGNIERHPANRQIDPESAGVKSLAESLEQDGLLNALIVRRKGPGYQLIAGERRWLAATSLGWESIDCYVIECSDAEALRLLNVDNAQREDLTAAEKARAIAKLHEPAEQGGGGLSWEAAGKIYGMSASGAQNLCAILKAPAVWLERMEESGRSEDGGRKSEDKKIVHQATVREIAKYADHPKVLAEIEKEYKKGYWPAERDSQVSRISRHVEHVFRPLNLQHGVSTPSGYRYELLKVDGGDPAVCKELEIASLPIGEKGKLIAVALNVKAFDERLKKQVMEAAKKKEAKKDKTAAAKAKERTPAELKAIHKKQDEQIARNIAEWRLAMLRCWCVTKLKAGHWTTTALLPLLLAETCGDSVSVIEDAIVPGGGRGRLHEQLFARLSKVEDEVSELDAIHLAIVRELLWPARDKAKPNGLPLDAIHHLDAPVVEAIAKHLGVTIAEAWREAAADEMSDAGQMILRFFAMHNARQLGLLASEYSVMKAGPGSPKSELASEFAFAHFSNKPLKLPSCLGGSKPKAKGKA